MPRTNKNVNGANNSNAGYTSGNETPTIQITRVEIEKLFKRMDTLNGEDAIFYSYLATTHIANIEERQMAMEAVLDFYAEVRNLIYEIKDVFQITQQITNV